MSLHPQLDFTIPEQTSRIARRACRKGNPYMMMRDKLGTIFTDEQFSDLYPNVGHSALPAWKLALVTVIQFAEGLSDRQMAQAVRTRIDLKYALGMELEDEGFDHSVLCEFRNRLIAGAALTQLLETMLTRFVEMKLLKVRGKQRTDSTHVLAAVRQLNHLESVGETLRAALEEVAAVAPEWLMGVINPAWVMRYGTRFDEYRLPKGETPRQELAEQIGRDGFLLMQKVYGPTAPPQLAELPEIEVLRRTWIGQFYRLWEGSVPEGSVPEGSVPEGSGMDKVNLGTLRWRKPDERPPATWSPNSPYDTDAGFGNKRSTKWMGYKYHVTETCDKDFPRLITDVQTTHAARADYDVVATVHAKLQERNLLPAKHYMDAGYVDAALVMNARERYGIDVVGPVKQTPSWQAKNAEGFALKDFHIDWSRQQVTCPQGKVSRSWHQTHDARGLGPDKGRDVVQVRFGRSDCALCPHLTRCTRSAQGFRGLTFALQEEYLSLEEARKRQKTPEFQKDYAHRAGIEGTISQEVRAYDVRQARYRGMVKTSLQHVFVACANNLCRVADWLGERRPAKTRISHLKKLYAST